MRFKQFNLYACQWLTALFVIGSLVFAEPILGQAPAPSPATRLPLSIPFDFVNNQVFMKVSINGSSPVWFILDSGASACVVDAALAQNLHLQIEGEKQGTGAGKGTVTVRYAKSITYGLPGIAVPVENSYVIDLSGQPALQGREVGGILGYDFFVRYVVDVDYSAHVMTLWEAASYTYRGTGKLIQFALVKKTPRIRARIGVGGQAPIERELLVDSGSEDAVDDDLFAKSSQRLEVIGGVGLGQEFRTTLGRADSVQIGDFLLVQPFGATGGVPLLGTEVLRRFRVIFDYSRRQIALEPNPHFDEPFLFDASGLDLRWAPGFSEFVVHDVAQDSPAMHAGVQTNDAIVEINGQAASSFTLEQVTAMLAEAGQSYRLTIRRKGSTQEITIALAKRL
jgi:aspartyl protease/PDZ domain-containing protein